MCVSLETDENIIIYGQHSAMFEYIILIYNVFSMYMLYHFRETDRIIIKSDHYINSDDYANVSLSELIAIAHSSGFPYEFWQRHIGEKIRAVYIKVRKLIYIKTYEG